jgi:hypothetical protein
VRVSTHSAHEPYRYSQFCDTSPDPLSIEFVKATKLCRLSIGLCVNYTAQASQSFNCQEHHFKHHNIRDSHYDFHVQRYLDDQREHILLSNGNSAPWFANLYLYWACSLIGFGWFIRVLLYTSSQRVTFEVNKLIIA